MEDFALQDQARKINTVELKNKSYNYFISGEFFEN